MEEMRLRDPAELLYKLRGGFFSPRETYRAVQMFGEKNFQKARPEVERLLTSDDPELRFVALKVLTRYWRLAEHWETARVVLEHDPDDECRFRAAKDLASLKQNTGDRATLEVLARVVWNGQEENWIVRQSAYAGMKEVLHMDPFEQSRLIGKGEHWEEDVDWDMVKSYLTLDVPDTLDSLQS